VETKAVAFITWLILLKLLIDLHNFKKSDLHLPILVSVYLTFCLSDLAIGNGFSLLKYQPHLHLLFDDIVEALFFTLRFLELPKANRICIWLCIKVNYF
jgi:hypothetical protein